MPLKRNAQRIKKGVFLCFLQGRGGRYLNEGKKGRKNSLIFNCMFLTINKICQNDSFNFCPDKMPQNAKKYTKKALLITY